MVTSKVIAALILLCGAGVAMCQGVIIQGVITDSDGQPIAGSVVTIEETETITITDQKGRYKISDIREGNYLIRVSAQAYRTQLRVITVSAGQTLDQDFVLQIDLQAMEQLVVTGTTAPEQKIESSTSISSLTTAELNDAAPRSTTEFLRRVPGFTRVESSGGEVNQNLSVRGLLGVTSVNLQEDGMVVYPTMEIFFMNADNLIRPDENLEEVEILRGGTSPIFGSSTAGATVNFLNKTGGTELEGVWKVTGGASGLARFDFNMNGPLADNWRFNIGGFYRYDHGVRDPGFPGTKGGQLKASLTRILSNGFFRISLKHIDDRNLFLLPLPFQNPGNPEHVPGFSETGSFYSGEAITEIPLPEGRELHLPVDEGIQTKGSWLTGQFTVTLGDDWEFENITRVMSVDHNWTALPSTELLTAADFAERELSAYVTFLGVDPSSTYHYLFTNHLDPSGNRLLFDTPNDLVRPGGIWHIQKPISDFSNLLTVRKTIGSHHFSFGTHFAYYTQGNRWYITDVLTDVRDNPRFLDLVFIQPDGSTVEVTKNGFRRFLGFHVNGDGSNTLFALFTSDELKLTDRLRLDLGFRYERANYFQVTENLAPFDLDGNPRTQYDFGFSGNQTFRQFEFDIDDMAFSAGANYEIHRDRLSIYGSFTRGFRLPAVDEFLFEPNDEFINLFRPYNTKMYEAGMKYSSSVLAFTAAFFYGRVYNLINRQVEMDPATGAIRFFTVPIEDSTSWGLELEVLTKPARQLQLRTTVTALSAEAPEQNLIGEFYEGFTPAVLDFEASYAIFSNTRLIFDWHYVGSRFSDSSFTRRLSDYSYINLAASRQFGAGFTVTGRILNLTQSRGLEEHNPLGDAIRDPSSNLFLSRPILPRRFTLEARYDF